MYKVRIRRERISNFPILIAVRITSYADAQLRQRAQELGTSVSECIRQALDAWLGGDGDETPDKVAGAPTEADD